MFSDIGLSLRVLSLYLQKPNNKKMSVQEIAERLVALSREGKYEQVYQELFSPEIESMEPKLDGSWDTAKGFDELKAKADKWNKMCEAFEEGEISDPIVAENFFSCSWKMRVKFKGAPEFMQMDEIAVYRVKEGKVVLEQFFYTPFE